MDPSSQAFTPYGSNNDTWRLQSEVSRLQQIQVEHADRLARLERRQDDDARMKSVWGQGSPFPSVLSGTPQQAPLQHPVPDQFRGFDDDANNLISSLHLDAEEEPRRALGAASRANSVRFDESANQNHFSHPSRTSMEMVSRTSSGLGGIRMDERTSSHKSEGRASSAHSMRSAASGRASSFNLDSTYGIDAARSPLQTPAIAPGLLLLGTAPAIVRCWLNTNFKNDALLYAAICTGSHRSLIDSRLVRRLGVDGEARTEPNGAYKVELPVYFTEAVPHPASSRSSSPAPQLPTISVDFQIVDVQSQSSDSKAIQVFLGSEVLRAHRADVLFSSSSVTLFDDEDTKVSIPMVRPEDEAAFKHLRVFHASRLVHNPDNLPTDEKSFLDDLEQTKPDPITPSTASSGSFGKVRPPSLSHADGTGTVTPEIGSRPSSRVSNIARPAPQSLNLRAENDDSTSLAEHSSTLPMRASANVSSPATSMSWRREPSTAAPTATTPSTSNFDWAAASKSRPSEVPYQRKDTGIKILKPKASLSRTISSASTATPAITPLNSTSTSASPVETRSRFFDEGRRRSGGDTVGLGVPSSLPKSASSSAAAPVASAAKVKANPIGGASAFSWLNSSGGGGSATSGNRS